MKLLAFAASLRTGSWNRKLIVVAVEIATGSGAEVDLADFREFHMPIYDADLQATTGIPAGAQELGRRVAAADGLMIASPEYNFSLPGTLKNAIDWVSRINPMPLRGKTGLLLSASSGQVGGIRGLWQLRIPLEGLGVTLHPDMYTLPWAKEQFDERGRLKEPERQERLEKMVGAYLAMARKLAG
jgi:chromate reductase, NAD(P)H dehydrogenase (quinone)